MQFNMATVSAAPTSEAQRLMMMSVDKIVASRNRRGGVSLHRNLLVAGVLFRARDSLLAAQKTASTISAPVTSDTTDTTSGTPPSTRSTGNASTSDQGSSSSVTSSTASSKSEVQASESSGSRSEDRTRNPEAGAANDVITPMDVSVCDGKENVPPSTCTQTQLSKTSNETDLKSSADASTYQTSRKRCHSVTSSSTSDPVDRKLIKMADTVESQVQSRKRSTSCSVAKVTVPKSSSSPSSCRQTNQSPVINSVPVVYLNRIDSAAFARATSSTTSTAVPPYCAPSSGLGVIDIRPVYVVQVV